jgi:phosphohistidine phosphatase SixA
MTQLKFDRDNTTAEKNRIFKAAYDGEVDFIKKAIDANSKLLNATDEVGHLPCLLLIYTELMLVDVG